jgi:murein DD-endopeptidase MepM/ murein hydrolase activator NlpD
MFYPPQYTPQANEKDLIMFGLGPFSFCKFYDKFVFAEYYADIVVKIYLEVARMSNLHLLNNKPRKNNSKGFYIALGVCLIAVGVAAWTTYDSVVNYATPNEGATSSAEAQHTNETVSGIKVLGGDSEAPAVESAKPEPSSALPKTPSQAPSSAAVKTPAKQASAKALTFTYPVGKTVLEKYSGETPVYSKTMKDWRVHTGVDFSAKPGDSVKSSADGTVKDIYTDDLYGNTVVIMHGNVETYYCGLKEMNVKKGASVKQGQKIGTVGTPAFEGADDAHLHLAMKKNGKFMDPLSVIK